MRKSTTVHHHRECRTAHFPTNSSTTAAKLPNRRVEHVELGTDCSESSASRASQSGTPVSRASQAERDEPPVRRVREEVRDSVAVCVCTLCASTVVALGLDAGVEVRRLNDGQSPSPPGARRPGRCLGRPGARRRPQRLGRRDLGPRRSHRSDLDQLPQRPRRGARPRRGGLRLAADRLEPFGGRITFVHAVYDELPRRPERPGSAAGPRRAVRPRRLLDAAGRGRSRIRLQP